MNKIPTYFNCQTIWYYTRKYLIINIVNVLIINKTKVTIDFFKLKFRETLKTKKVT